MENYLNYILPALFLAYFIWRSIKVKKTLSEVPKLLQDGAIIIDVRSPQEFAGGHAKGSINIPLDQLAQKANTLDKSKPLILCCLSGNRSGAAVGLLKSKGFLNVHNAGRWQNLASS